MVSLVPLLAIKQTGLHDHHPLIVEHVLRGGRRLELTVVVE